MFAEVVLANATKTTDKIYHYLIPDALAEKVQIGSQVLVPFGRRKDIGYVVGRLEKSDVLGVREILDVSPEPVFDEKRLLLARWIADYYLCYFSSALKLILPPGAKKFEARVRVKKPVKKPDVGMLAQQPKTNDQTGFLTQQPTSILEPTLAQKAAIKAINKATSANTTDKFLLHGITGSGKTEVYLQTIANIMRLGKSAIVLVPEIGLTPQLVERFHKRFPNNIALLHSGLPDKTRKEEWHKVESGVGRIVLGTRLALFAPVKNLGLIVLDEEYENTYKSDQSPRYHAREVALKLAELNQAVVLLGSATPALETYYKSETKEYLKLILPKRIDDRPLPPVTVVDMRQEMKAKNFGVLSKLLKEELQDTVARHEQAILFINRVGYFTFVMCRECGLTIECPHCSGSLTYHTSDTQLHCGHCGFTSAAPIICPRCQSSSIKYFGTGTQRIEKEVAELLPAVRILRLDRDTVTKKGSHEIIFKTFCEGKADVLIGTQMVTKGLDLAGVTLVGAVAADTALNLPDFRSAEHTFQLLTQVAGRAGRHQLPGKVIIQTYNPDHYAIRCAAEHDYEGFYAQEIVKREELAYPPFTSLISLMVSSIEQKKASRIADELGSFLKKRLPEEVRGPAPAALTKSRGRWRYQLLLKGKDLNALRLALLEVMAKIVVPVEVRITVDVEPLSLI